MEARVSEAFAPAAVSNFFAIHDEALTKGDYSDFRQVGATGGGFTLSKGVYTKASVFNGSNARKVRIKVNGDANYRATTTRRAIELLVDSVGARFSTIEVEQLVEVPIGYGFGTSAASALSAVLAAAGALDIALPKDGIAYFAHAADIICQTGMGTVSSIWEHSGAGLITRPGAPGVAMVTDIPIPPGLKIVTALLAPVRKSRVLSSKVMRRRVNRLGNAALSSVLADPTFDNLVKSGTRFAEKVRLATEEVRRLISLSVDSGAVAASQNMIGHAVHAIVPEEESYRVVRAMRSDPSSPIVLEFDFGNASASAARPTPFPTLRLSAQSDI